jgi:O-acetylhomoserine (thiol)-lyase
LRIIKENASRKLGKMINKSHEIAGCPHHPGATISSVSVFMDELHMSGPRFPGFDTLSLHAGPSATPVNTILEDRIAMLEGGVAAIAAASSQAALHLGLATLASNGSHVVAARGLAPGAVRLLTRTLPRFGVTASFVDARDPDAWRAAIRPETRLLLAPVLGDGALEVADIPNLAGLAHEHDLPLMIDATLATPWLMQPIELGADLVLHAADGLLGGQGGGLLVDGGSFDWERAHARGGRFAELLDHAEESTVGAFALRARREVLPDLGAALGTHDAQAILQGIETLGLRMERHVANTRKLAQALASHAALESVTYPELESHPDHALAQRLLPKGAGATLHLQLRGGGAAATRFIDGLKLVQNGAGPGQARSLANHPASTTHAGLPAGLLADLSIDDGTVRLAVGLEDADDLLEDLARALKLSQKGA